jgi:hypothetical protein
MRNKKVEEKTVEPLKTKEHINRKLILKYLAALELEYKTYGTYDDFVGRRYLIPDLFMDNKDYESIIRYKRWFDIKFPGDIGTLNMSFCLEIASHETGKVNDAKIYSVDTAFQNVFIHSILLHKVDITSESFVNKDNLFRDAQHLINQYKKNISPSYIKWLAKFVDTKEYKESVNEYINLNNILSQEINPLKRLELVERITALEAEYRTYINFIISRVS